VGDENSVDGHDRAVDPVMPRAVAAAAEETLGADPVRGVVQTVRAPPMF